MVQPLSSLHLTLIYTRMLSLVGAITQLGFLWVGSLVSM